jgi:hypothetical protein
VIFIGVASLGKTSLDNEYFISCHHKLYEIIGDSNCNHGTGRVVIKPELVLILAEKIDQFVFKSVPLKDLFCNCKSLEIGFILFIKFSIE